MGNVLIVLQLLVGVVFIVLMAVQTDEAEAGGVMGLGSSGGRMSGSIDMEVGADRILKPFTKWTVIGFLFLSVLAAKNGVNPITIWGILIAVVLFVLTVFLADRIWNGFEKIFGS